MSVQSLLLIGTLWLASMSSAAAADVISLQGGCRFKVTDLQKGRLSDSRDQDPRSLAIFLPTTYVGSEKPLELFCRATNNQPEPDDRPDEDLISFELGATQVNGQWIPTDLREKTCDARRFPTSQRKNIDPNARCFYPNEHFRAFSVRAKNGEIKATLLDMTTGEPKSRWRNLSYCLVPDHDASLAVCGQVHVLNLAEPRSDILSKILKVLGSIEFVRDASQSTHP